MKSTIVHYFLCCLSCISPRLNFAYRYWKNLGRKVNLQQPHTFNEKIIWLELERYINDALVIQCSDKYKVREYVKKCGCEELLIPQIGVWDRSDEIEWDSLPNKFVLKWNFGAGFNFVCDNKKKYNKILITQKLNKWGKSKYWLCFGEQHYKKIPKKIICEKYISSIDMKGAEKNSSPDDYKFYCFNGKVEYILLCKNRKGMKADYIFFDKDWNVQPFSAYAIEHSDDISIKKPDALHDAINYAEKLAKPFPFVRVDFYILENKIYFGELTFTPCGGVDSDLFEGDYVMGKLLDIANC